MPITLQHQGDNVYRLEARGTLLKADLDRCQDELAGQMVRTGPVRVLFVLAGFTGWEKDANWSDLSFYMKHGDRIERIAIVGDERWRDEVLMFAAAGLRKGPVEFFTEEADARKWLTAEGRPAGP